MSKKKNLMDLKKSKCRPKVLWCSFAFINLAMENKDKCTWKFEENLDLSDTKYGVKSLNETVANKFLWKALATLNFTKKTQYYGWNLGPSSHLLAKTSNRIQGTQFLIFKTETGTRYPVNQLYNNRPILASTRLSGLGNHFFFFCIFSLF